MSYLESKIEANDRTVREILENQKYVVDYYQREYNWEQSHIEQLVTDLCNAFLENYQPSHQRPDVENYNSYYLGPIIFSAKGNQKSIIDGQQRLTSLTLFIIYLNNLQKEWGISENIETMVFSERYGQKSFNLNVPEREACLDALFNYGAYEAPDDADASTRNMAARYLDIGDAFSEEITQEVLPAFLDWLREKVVLVEIIAYSDENAYTIFETMNDRGLNLTPTEMLKGFLLSKFRDDDQRRAANDLWKRLVDELQAYDKTEDLTFFQAFLRAKYAETIRAGQAGSVNEDFEKIGTRFHNWVRENPHKMGLHQSGETSFHELVFGDINYYQKAYCRILDAEQNFDKELEHVYYISRWGIAKSLRYPLLLAPVTKEDTIAIANQKINLVAKYIDNFCVRRSVNFRNFAASSIRYTMYNLVREIRNMPLDALHDLLASKLDPAALMAFQQGLHCLYGEEKTQPLAAASESTAIKQARHYFTEAAQHNYAPAQYQLGLLAMHEGHLVAASAKQVNSHYERAHSYFAQAARQGNAGAQYQLGMLYTNPDFLHQDAQLARAWYEQAAQQGVVAAQRQLGIMYAQGLGGYQDSKQAQQWLYRAAQAGDAAAQYQLACQYGLVDGRMRQAVPRAQRNDRQAQRWLEQAAQQEYPPALTALGVMYEQGRLVHQDYVKARQYYTRAAAQGEALAQNNLGRLYELGRGTRWDHVLARQFYTQAAQQGLAQAQYHLAMMLKDGKGGAQDPQQAQIWLQRAADQGYARALAELK